jgi:acetoacetyl-CoA synthetase
MTHQHDGPLWLPSADAVERANITRFTRWVAQTHDVTMSDYAALHRWSIDSPEVFWQSVWDFCGVVAERQGATVTANYPSMPGSEWFPDVRLNFAQNLLRRRDDAPAIIFGSESGLEQTWSYAQLYAEVNAVAKALRGVGVGRDDVVVGWLPNIPQTIAASLGAASLGAIWASCSTDFGVEAVVDRFSQLSPKILFAVDGYQYAGKHHDCLSRLVEIQARMPSIEHTVLIPYLDSMQPRATLASTSRYGDWIGQHPTSELMFESLPFNHPLYVLFSSGTTGKPKGIIHGAGGTLLQHLKEHQLHTDIRPGDRVFYYTTCGWMMWNWLVSALASGATVMLYDGSPVYPHPDVLFDFVTEHRASVFGVSAKYIDSIRQHGIRPVDSHDLSALRTILSTGSPLAPDGFDYVYDAVKPTVCLSSISGGTDIISCFALGNPTLPVYCGELQCKGLGMDVAVYDEQGQSIEGVPGELVCRKPFPSMPLGFWNDPTQSRYRAAYFDRFNGIWHHGDYAELTANQGLRIYGRSDATLNPGGVRIGTAEIYQQVERIPEVLEALAIGQEWNRDTRIVLFVKLQPNLALTPQLTEQICHTIRAHTTPRHVPAKVLQVPDIPRTKSGKITELAVRAVVHGQPVQNLTALANPEALEHFRDRPELL